MSERLKQARTNAQKRYYEKNREKIKQNNREWRKNHKKHLAEYMKNYRLRRKGTEPAEPRDISQAEFFRLAHLAD